MELGEEQEVRIYEPLEDPVPRKRTPEQELEEITTAEPERVPA